MTLPTDPTATPTGLDYLAAFAGMFPAMQAEGRRPKDLSSHNLRILDRAARLIVSTRTEAREGICSRIREIHKPYGIYDECDHADHGEDEPGVIDTGDFLTCKDGLKYQVCTACCLTNQDMDFSTFQTEDCATGHDHGPGKPICATIAALEA